MKLLTLVLPHRCGLLLASTLCLLMASSARADYDFWAGVPGTSESTNWTTATNWTQAVQTYYNEVEFTGIGANPNTSTAVNNVLDDTTGVSQMPIWELDYVPTNGNYTTLINPGVTLRLEAGRGFLYVGADQLHTSDPAPANAVETITITGAGAAMSMMGNMYVGQGSATPGDSHNVTLDLSGLDNFTDTGSQILVASGGAARTHGTLYLAKTNQIALGNDFQLCNQTFSNSVPCAVYLGQANSILTGSGNLIIGGFGTTTVGAWMKFNPAFVGGGNVPTASLGSTASDGRIINFWIGNANGGPQIPGSALCDFSGGNVSVLARTMQLGQGGNAGANAQGVLTLDNGIVDVNNAMIGNQEVSGGGMGVGVVNLNSNNIAGGKATLRINNTLTLAAVSGTVTPGSAGTINLKGGTLAANTIVNGGGSGAINATNGTLAVTGSVGTPTAPLNVLTLVNSTLSLAAAPGFTNIYVTSLATGGTTNIINITSVRPSPAYPVKITLAKFPTSIGGSGFNFGVGTLPALTSGYVSNDTVNASLVLVLTAGPLTYTWTGAHSGDWDTTTLNWTAGSPVTYADGAFVQFLDGASVSTINLTATLLPGGVTVSNSALNYTFNGNGKISGGSALVKQGNGTLVLDNTSLNDFTGGTTINGGTIQVGNGDTSGNVPGAVADSGVLAFNRSDDVTVNNAISGTGGFTQKGANTTLTLSGPNTFTGAVLVTNGSTLKLGSSTALGNGGAAAIVANGSTLDVNGFTATKTLMVAGAGLSGNGALTSGNSVYDQPGPGAATNIILTGDTTFTFPVRWDLGANAGGSVLQTDGHAYNLTLSGSGYFEWNNLSVLSPLANITIANGTLGVVNATTFGDPNGTLVLSPGAGLTIYGPNVFINKKVDFQNGATISTGGGNNLMNGAMTLEAGFASFNIGGGTSLTLSNVLSGSGIFDQTGGGTVTLWGNSPLFTGGVQLFSGQFNLNALIGSGITTVGGTTLTGSGTANGAVDIGGSFYPGGASAAGTFTASAGLVLEGGAAITMDLAPTTTVGGGVNDLVAITGDLSGNGNNIVINPLTGSLATGTYVLMTYTGNLTSTFGSAFTASTSRYTLTLDTSTPHQVKLIVSGTANVLAWNNGGNNNEWDVQNSLNWSNLTTHVEDQFFTSDAVLLDDRGAQGPHPSTSLTIDGGTAVAPSVITNNSSTNYTISGSGKITGGASVVKLGSSTLTINTTNDFTGNFNILAGGVQMNGQLTASGSPLGAASSTVIITNGAQLLVNLQGGYASGDIGFAAKPVIVSGSGVDGKGAIQIIGNPIYNDGNTLTGLGANVRLAGDTVIGGTTRWDWGYPGLPATLSTSGSNYNFTAIESGYTQWKNLTIDTNLGNFDFYQTANNQQTWSVTAMGGSLGNPTNVLTLHSNVIMVIGHDSPAGSGDSGYAKVIHILPSSGFQYQPSGGSGDYRLATSFVMDDNSAFNFYSGNGGSGSGTVITGTVKLNGLVHLQIGDSTVTFSNVISGAGGFYWDNYNNTVLFTAANTYQGITDIRSGRTLALAGNGSISASTNISLAASATLDVSGRTDQTLTLVSGQTLQGNGTVNGNLSVSSSSTVSPGGPNTIGTLTVTNAINLSGMTSMEVNKTAGTKDQLNSATTITYGGTLNIANLGGTLVAGDSFKLFNAATYNGTFATVTPIPGPGLAWDQSSLSTGTIKVIASSTTPSIGQITISGGSVIIRGNNNTGAGGTYHILTSTNLASPLASWTALTNGTFDGSGNFSTTNALGTAARQFYILQVP